MKSLFAGALALSLAAASAGAATYRLGAVEVVQPWSRPAAAHMTGVGYMTLKNTGARPDALVGVTSPLANKVEIHATSMTGGVMRMTRVAQVTVPAGGQVVFSPGAYHLMLVGLKAPLKAGDEIPAVLAFANGVHLKVDFAVGSGLGPPAGGAMAGMPGMGPMGH